MDSGGGQDDTVIGPANGDSLAPILGHVGERQVEESKRVEGRGGGHLAASHPPTSGSRPGMLHVPAEHEAHVEPAGMRGCPRYA